MRTSLAAPTNAPHSIFGKKPLKKSGLNSASRSSIWTSLNINGKLLDVQFLTWQASRLWVIKRTMLDDDWGKTRQEGRLNRCHFFLITTFTFTLNSDDGSCAGRSTYRYQINERWSSYHASPFAVDSRARVSFQSP